MRPHISKRGRVRPSVGMSVRRSVTPPSYLGGNSMTKKPIRLQYFLKDFLTLLLNFIISTCNLLK